MDKNQKYMYLYHGTTSISAIDIIKSGGLKPRVKTNSENQIIVTTTKQMDAIYLTKNKDSAISYGYNRTDDRGWSVCNGKIVLPVVFTILIDTETDLLHIDEDYLADDIGKKTWKEFLLKNKIIYHPCESKNWTYFYERQPELAQKILKLFPWQNSLKQSGSVTFEGDINLDKFKYIDIYYDPKNYIRLQANTLDDLQNAYDECCNVIINNYNTQYKNEMDDTKELPNPYKYEILKLNNNKLDGTIYKNINSNTLKILNNLSKKYNYPLFDKTIITQTGTFYMQHNSYIKLVDDITDTFDTNKYLIFDLDHDNSLSISYFTYIRNNIGFLLTNKKLINELGKGKKIIFEMKYHDIKFFNNLEGFWNFVNKVEIKEIIIPAKKR